MQLSRLQTLTLAATALLQAGAAQATTAPVDASVGFKWLNYQETQGDDKRMRVQAQSAFVVMPLPHNWVLDASAVIDDISGASPAYYTEPLSYARVTDKRQAQDLRLSWYRNDQRWAVGRARSEENDYHARNTSWSYQQSTPDRNTTWDLAYSRSDDLVAPVNRIVTPQPKRTQELLVGGTWVLTPQDLVQLSLTRSWARGYLNDPYKFFDLRPDHRTVSALSAKWNHRFAGQGTVQRLSARWTEDSFAVRSITLQGEWSQPLANGWTLTPLLRYYSQTAAYFFAPPDPANPSRPQIPQGAQLGLTPMSFDQRLAAFGALTQGLKIEKKLDTQTTLDLRLDHYTQKNKASLLAPGTRGLADFKATFVQVGITQRF